MEKYRNYIRLEKIRELLRDNKASEAMALAEGLEIGKIKSTADLSMLADMYMDAGKLSKAKECLVPVYAKSKTRRVLMQLINLSIRAKNIESAERYYRDFKLMSKGDFYNLIYRYSIEKMKGTDIDTLIGILEQLKDTEYIEVWAYELAKLYHKRGDREKCIAECNDIEIWFGDGEYVDRARALRAYYLGDFDINAVSAPEDNSEDAGSEADSSDMAGTGAEPDGQEYTEYNPVTDNGMREEAEEDVYEDYESFTSEDTTEIVSDNGYKEEQEEETLRRYTVSSEKDEDEELIYRLLAEENAARTGNAQQEDDTAGEDTDLAENAQEDNVAGEGAYLAENAQENNEVPDNADVFADTNAENAQEADDVAGESAGFAEGAQEEYSELEIIRAAARVAEDAISEEETDIRLPEADIDAAADEAVPAIDFGSDAEFAEEAELGETQLAEHEFAAVKEYPVNSTGYLGEFLRKEDTNLEQLFGFFGYQRDVRSQLIKCLEILLNPQIKNICLVVTGEKNSGKKTVIKGVMKILNRAERMNGSKMALTEGVKINRMKLSEQTRKLNGCCLVINRAGQLSHDAAEELLKCSNLIAGKTAITLTDTRTEINKLFRDNRELNAMFPVRIHIPSFRMRDYQELAFAMFKEAGYGLSAAAEKEFFDEVKRISVTNGDDALPAVEKYIETVIDNAQTRDAGAYISDSLKGGEIKLSGIIYRRDLKMD